MQQVSIAALIREMDVDELEEFMADHSNSIIDLVKARAQYEQLVNQPTNEKSKNNDHA